MKNPNLNLVLIYKASCDGFKANDFHNRCDNQGPTICLIKSELGNTFGGYAHPSWHLMDDNIFGEGNSFLFQLDYNTKHSYIGNKELFGCGKSLMVFGLGCDLCEEKDSDRKNISFSNLGLSYQLPEGMEYGSKSAKIYMAGEKKFRTEEIEVFKVLD